MSQEKLLLQIVEKLRADTVASIGLVPLTTHTSAEHHISRDSPNVKERTPFLGVRVADSVPLIGSDVTHMQIATVELWSHDRDELIAIKIADRLETLLHAKTAAANTGYYSFSGTSVSTRMVRFMSRDGQTYDEDKDVWSILIQISVIWVDSPCPV